MKNSKVVSFLSPFKVGQVGKLWTLPRTVDEVVHVRWCLKMYRLASILKRHHHNHHHHISVMQLGHLLTRSGLTYPEVSSKVYHDSFCQSDSSVSFPWVIYFEVFYLHVVSSLSRIPVICPKLVLFSLLNSER